jgi:hypothetical protein
MIGLRGRSIFDVSVGCRAMVDSLVRVVGVDDLEMHPH